MKPTLSLVMIVCNEAHTLARALNSALPLVEQIIIVDTGSTDQTLEIAASFHAKIYHYQWQEDFAAARNFGLEHTESEWVLVLDADEELVCNSGFELHSLLLEPEIDGYFFKIYNLTEKGDYITNLALRLFRNHPEYRFTGALHEQLLIPEERLGKLTEPIIRHYGYLAEYIRKNNKSTRNLRIAARLVAENSTNGFYHFNLGMEYLRLQEYDSAAKHLQLGYQLGIPNSQCASCSLKLALQALRTKKEWLTWQSLWEDGIGQYSNYTDLWFERALGEFEQNHFKQALLYLERCLALGESSDEYIVNAGAGSWKAWGLISMITQLHGELAIAQNSLITAVKDNPNFAPHLTRLAELSLILYGQKKLFTLLRSRLNLPIHAWLQLSITLALRGAPFAAEKVLNSIINQSEANNEINFLQALIYLANQQFEAALSLLHQLPENFTEVKAIITLSTLLQQASARQPQLSLCMIVRDEAACLGKCLQSVQGIVDEVIIVDTGSQDQTKELAATFDAKVYDYPWNNDFATARNYSLAKATGDWILYLDADEYLEIEDGQRLRELLLDQTAEGYLLLEINHFTSDTQHDQSTHITMRLFRNRPEYRFQGRIHETIIPDFKQFSPQSFRQAFDVRLYHDGYLFGHPKLAQKISRNLELLLVEAVEKPADAFTQFNLGVEYFRLKKYAKAEEHFKNARQTTPSESLFFPRLIKNSIICLIQMADLYQARQLIWYGLSQLPDFNELYYWLGVIYQKKGLWSLALQAFTECGFLGAPPPHYNSVHGLDTYRTHLALANCYHLLDLPELEAKELSQVMQYETSVELQETIKTLLSQNPIKIC